MTTTTEPDHVPTSTDSARGLLGAWWMVALLSLAAVLSYADRQLLNLMVDHVKRDLALDDIRIGLLQGVAFALIYATAGLPLGRLADRASRRLMILAGIAIWSVATLACGYAENFPQLFAARFLVGVGEAVLTPASISMIADAFPARRRGLATGIFLMGMSIGGGFGLWAGGILYRLASDGIFAEVGFLNLLAPWRVPFVCLGLVGLVFSASLLTIREPRRGGSAPDPTGAVGTQQSLWEQRSAVTIFAVATALMAMTGFVAVNWAPALLGRKFGLDPGQVGAQLGPLLAATGIIGSIGAGLLSDRLGGRGGPRSRLRLQVFIMLGAAVTALASLCGSMPAYFAIFAIGTLLNNMGGLNAMTTLQELVPPRSRGFAASLLAFGNLSMGLGAGMVLTAFLIEKVYRSQDATDLAIATIAVPASLLGALLYRHLARKTPPAGS